MHVAILLPELQGSDDCSLSAGAWRLLQCCSPQCEPFLLLSCTPGLAEGMMMHELWSVFRIQLC